MENKNLHHIANCPVCEKTEFVDFLKSKDFTFSKEEFTVQKCVSCGFRFTNPIPTEENIGSYYDVDNYMSHATNAKKGLMPFVYKKVRNINVANKIKLVNEFAQGKSLLDIGAGNGFFLNACKNSGFEVAGLEPDENARRVALSDYSLSLQDPCEIKNIPDQSVDVITMWHVLEHVYHLKRDIAEYKRVLKDDGAIVLALPNIDSFDANHYKEYWDGLDLPIHLYHFTPKDVSNLFSSFDMEVVKMEPMKFDAYWVSMNSEKFKEGSTIKAFYIALKSNLKAKNGKYSSQMYVLKKKSN